MTDKQKKVLADGLVNIGNIIFGGLVIARFIPQADFDLKVIVGGIIATALFYLVAVGLLKEQRN